MGSEVEITSLAPRAWLKFYDCRLPNVICDPDAGATFALEAKPSKRRFRGIGNDFIVHPDIGNV